MHMPENGRLSLVQRIRQRPELSTATIMMLTSADIEVMRHDARSWEFLRIYFKRSGNPNCEKQLCGTWAKEQRGAYSIDHAVFRCRIA